MTRPGTHGWERAIVGDGDYQEFVAGAVPATLTVARPAGGHVAAAVDVRHRRGFHRRFDVAVDSYRADPLTADRVRWEGMVFPGWPTLVRLALGSENLGGRVRLLFTSAANYPALWALAAGARLRIVVSRSVEQAFSTPTPAAGASVVDAAALAAMLTALDLPRRAPGRPAPPRGEIATTRPKGRTRPCS